MRKQTKKLILSGAITLLIAGASLASYRIISASTSTHFMQTYQPAQSEPILDLPSRSAVSMGGHLLSASKDNALATPTASTAKMILALIIREQHPFDLGEVGETITLNQNDVALLRTCQSLNGSCSPVIVGAEMTMFDALATVMIVSSNNLSDSLAIRNFGSLEAYRTHANARLQEWGIYNTHVGTDASGRDASSTSTPEDLVRLGEKILADPVLNKIVNTTEMTVPVAGRIVNQNRALTDRGFTRVRTGWIGTPSGFNMVASAKHLGEDIVVAVMGRAERPDSSRDAIQILEQIKDKINMQTLISTGQKIGYVDTWWHEPIPVFASADIEVIGKGLDWQIQIQTNNIRAGQSAGQIGTLTVTHGNQQLTAPIKITSDIPSPSLLARLTRRPT
ncbi:serine hydrolase [Candidatus Saccharibacteria bacterium]|nr:serine hydrolase [Candidatus Saccharibacteria bacterium]